MAFEALIILPGPLAILVFGYSLLELSPYAVRSSNRMEMPGTEALVDSLS